MEGVDRVMGRGNKGEGWTGRVERGKERERNPSARLGELPSALRADFEKCLAGLGRGGVVWMGFMVWMVWEDGLTVWMRKQLEGNPSPCLARPGVSRA